MKAEDQYLIRKVEVWVTREGKGIVEERHLKTPEDHVYYKVVGKQERYVVCGIYGICYLPAQIYESAIRDECYFASGIIRPTRKYLRELDRTYFRFYDDAEEVKNNIIVFLQWLRKVPTMGLKRMKEKAIVETYRDLIRDVHATQEWTEASKIICEGKKRSDLASFARSLADERDLVPEKD